MRGLSNSIAERRARLRLSRAALARSVDISRQALGAIEDGRATPSTRIALGLARALGCSVEELFSLEERLELPVRIATRPERVGSVRRGRVLLGRIGERWVAHPLPAERLDVAADAELIEHGDGPRARLFDAAAPERLLLAGCDPALGVLATAASRAGIDVVWLPHSSGDALAALADDEAHVAGTHLFDAQTAEHNVPFVRAAIERGCALVELAGTDAGLVVEKANPHRIRSAADLLSRRIINRPRGAGARAVLDRALAEVGIDTRRLDGYRTLASGHEAVARAVAAGRADAGVATATVAQAFGLGFIPLERERFDLVVPVERLEHPPVRRLLGVLASGPFRRQLEALGGYAVLHTGREVART